MSRIEAVHRHPAWRDRSNFIIAANIDPGSTGVTTEQLWARQDGDRYEICCIPFFVYDLALGDVVEVDGDYVMTLVVEKSGRYVFRVHFSQTGQAKDEVVERLQAVGALAEWSSNSLVALDAPDESHAREVADFLQEQEDAGRLVYETGKR